MYVAASPARAGEGGDGTAAAAPVGAAAGEPGGHGAATGVRGGCAAALVRRGVDRRGRAPHPLRVTAGWSGGRPIDGKANLESVYQTVSCIFA